MGPHEPRKEKLMQSRRADKKSEVFIDDFGARVEKRCFVLLCGDQTHTMSPDSNFLKVLTRINIFKEPREALKAILQVKLHSTIIELCTEIMSSGIGLIPEFKAFFRYEDLHFCTGRINRRLK